MPTDDARRRDTERATAFAQEGTVVVPEEQGGEEPSEASTEDAPTDGRDWDRIDAEDVLPDEYLDDAAAADAGVDTEYDDSHSPEDDRDFSTMTLDDLYDPADAHEADAEDVYTGGEDIDISVEVPDGDEDAERRADDIPLTEFDPGTRTPPIGETDTDTADDTDHGAALHELSATRDDYRDVLAGAAEDILTGVCPFAGWRSVTGRATDGAGDYVAALDDALPRTMEVDGAAAATAAEAAAVFGAGTYDPDAFTPTDLGLDTGTVFGRVLYAFQQEFSEQGGMETVFEGDEDGATVIDTLSGKLSNYTNWANGGHGDPVDAGSIADLSHVATDDAGLEKVAGAAWNRGTIHGEVRSQTYVDKSESMEKLAAFTVQEVEHGLAALDAHIADADYSDSWVMAEDSDIETYVSAAVDAVTDGFRTVMTAARLWNHGEQTLSGGTETKQRYDDAAAFFPGNDHARQNRDSFHALAAEGVAMVEAGRDALAPALDILDAELGQWARVFEEQEVGALLDTTDTGYAVLEAAHDAYTAAKDGMADVAAELDSVLSYARPVDRQSGAAADIDAATAYLADLGTAVVDEMASDAVYGHAAVGAALKEDYLPSHTPQDTDARRDDLNQALRTFAGYVTR